MDRTSSSLPPREKETDKVISSFTDCIDEATLLDLAGRFSDTYSDLAKHSLDQFLVTPVTALPSGREQGNFICIDVGGSNLRVGLIELLGQVDEDGGDEQPRERIRRSHDKSWPIGDHLKMDQAEDLFTWIGDCMTEVIQDAMRGLPVGVSESPFGGELLLGITFSFPMAQKSLSEATLLPMGKGFAITSDLNLGHLLLAGYSAAVDKINSAQEQPSSPSSTSSKQKFPQLPKIRIAAITNDTVATFTSLAYAVKASPNSRVAMGLIVGTGTNATVPMPLSSLHPLKKNDLQNPDDVETVVVNTEWTINGTERPLRDLGIQNRWDRLLDRNSDRPGFQPFEYMTAGRYLGEIVRLAFVDTCCANADGDEARKLPRVLDQRNAISSKFLSEVVATTPDVSSLSEKLEAEFPTLDTGKRGGEGEGNPFWTAQRVGTLRSIAAAVQQRSSALIAAACIGLLDCVHDICIERPANRNSNVGQNGHVAANSSGEAHCGEELVIAYAGSTISQYPNWLADCQRWIDVLVREGSGANAGKRVVLREASDGGIIGAGVLAGMTARIA